MKKTNETNPYFLLLEKLYRESPSIDISEKSRIVIFSDLHMGDGRSMDDFHRNSELFRTALSEYYFKNDYTLVLNGDIEELQRYKLPKIRKQWKNIYDLFCRFRDNGRLYKIYGNHDSRLFSFHESDIGCETLKSLKLVVNQSNEIFIYHGHQASFYYNTFEDFMSLMLKFIAVPLRIRNYSVAYNNTKQSHVEKAAYNFAKNKQIISIIGHTHRPLFESFSKVDSLKFRLESKLREYQGAEKSEKQKIAEEIEGFMEELKSHTRRRGKEHSLSALYSEDIIVPCVFNSGCVLGKRGMTCLEISEGNIYLVHWYGPDIRKKYVTKDFKYMQKLENTEYIRHILKHDSLDYIFSRIKLLT